MNQLAVTKSHPLLSLYEKYIICIKWCACLVVGMKLVSAAVCADQNA